MKISIDDIHDLLLEDPIFKQGNYLLLSRLLSHVFEKKYSKGETIYSFDENAEFLYMVLHGSVSLLLPGKKKIIISESGRLGEECGTDLKHYLSTAVAETDVHVVVIPKSCISDLTLSCPGMKADFYSSLFNYNTDTHSMKSVSDDQSGKGRERIFSKQVAGWLSIVILFPATILIGLAFGQEIQVSLFMAILIVTLLMWIFKLVDEYIPALFAVFITVSMGLAPPKVVLSGFISDGFFLALSVFGLSSVILSSGLSYRVLLLLLLRLPGTQFWMNFGILMLGILITPLLPTANGRVVLIKPFLADMIVALGYKKQDKAATCMSVSSFTGVTILSGVFLTSKSVNLIIFGMLSPQEQDQFHWLAWLFSSSVTGFVMILLYFIAMSIFYRNGESLNINREIIATQLKMLGKMKVREWAAVFGILIFFAGIFTCSFHEIQPPWIALAVLYFLLLFGFLRKDEFRDKTDWPFLIYLGCIVGIVATFNYVGLSAVLIQKLSIFGDTMRSNFYLFVLSLSIIVIIIRIFVPINAAIIIIATVFMPVAAVSGISPWVIGFIVLVMGEMWFFPYQCSFYLQFQPGDKEVAVYNEKSFLKFNVIVNLIKIAAIYASIPFWKLIGLL